MAQWWRVILKMSVSRKLMHLPGRAGWGFIICCFSIFMMMLGYINLNYKLDQIRAQIGGTIYNGESQSSRSYSLQNPIEDDVVIIYNRVPKTGSTSFVGVAYDLCEENKFNVIHLNVSRNSHVMSLSDQIRFVNNVTNWNEKKPAFYHGHIAYINFLRFGMGRVPIYINVLREPIDRLVSYYYFLRYGDNYRPEVKRKKTGNVESFDDCVLRGGDDCNVDHLWLQIPFFCGHHDECWSVGSEWALEMAKQNLINNYLLVGMTDDLKNFVAVLELTLPRYFTGAFEKFNTGSRSHLRKTTNRTEPTLETIQKIQRSTIWKMENEFYLFAQEQFQYLKQLTLGSREGEIKSPLKSPQSNFWYEKIKPVRLNSQEGLTSDIATKDRNNDDPAGS